MKNGISTLTKPTFVICRKIIGPELIQDWIFSNIGITIFAAVTTIIAALLLPVVL
jgi:hypothetical protein